MAKGRRRTESSDPTSDENDPNSVSNPGERGPGRGVAPIAPLGSRGIREGEAEEEEQEEEEEKYLVGFVEVSVVGLQYYDGTVSNREMVRLIREPFNAYDGNAMRVENMRGEQVGHVERYKACYLAPLVDEGLVVVEGIVTRGNKRVYRMPCQVYIFSKFPVMETVLDRIRHSGLFVVTPSDPEFERNGAMAAPLPKQDAREQERSLDEIFDSLTLSRGKMYAMDPSPIIKTALYPHQREALAWLVQRENTSELPPFWKEQKAEGRGMPSYVNTLTNFMTNQRPEPFRGGILADDMGLGKTLTLVALIATNKPGSLLSPTEETDLLANSESTSTRPLKRHKLDESGAELCASSVGTKSSRSTLVVCPLSVMFIWISQLEDHTASGSLKVHLYHGSERIKRASVLGTFDIVLTTYNTLAAEGGDAKSPLQKVQWLRVVLDEAHVVKNPNARHTKATVSLKAERRWAITGTPIQNGAKDLCSLMMFLKLQPLDDKSFWNRTIQRPLQCGDASGYSRLQALLMAIALRRTKDMKVNGKSLVDLPRRTVTVHHVELSQEERQLYDKVELEGKQIVGQYIASGTLLQNFTTVLQILLRLRQICDHSALCPWHEGLLNAAVHSAGDLSSSPELLQKLLAVLQSGDDFDCPICLSPPTVAVITKCSHVFCRRCIEKTLMRDKQQCPLCRASLTAGDIFVSPAAEANDNSEAEVAHESSSKINALMELLTVLRENDPTVKSVVFSQFSGMLNYVQGPLDAAGFNYVRLDGSMSIKKREAAIKAFASNKPSSPSVFLLSLKAAGVGLNLVSASHVYMLDPWWNPAVEEQAMDRVHRLGQTRDVEIVRLIVKDSIEERVLEMQEKKRNLASSAFKKSIEAMHKTRIEDVQRLMQL